MARAAPDLIREMVRRTVINAPLSELTTMRVGGPADLLVEPADRVELGRLVAFLEARKIPWLPFGRGSNLIVRDGGIRGAVIRLGEGFGSVEQDAPTALGPTVRVGAASSLLRFVQWAAERGVGGFESLAGIPASLGGALAMNAGAWGFEIGERVLELEVMDARGEVRVLPAEELRFRYRHLELSPRQIVLGARLQGVSAEPTELRARGEELGRRRRATQPVGQPSAGSIFKNPPGAAAGRLIDECGLKGFRVGGAEVSTVHANFIVNAGSATAANVVGLMTMIQERVQVRHGVGLEPEVRIVGDWEKATFASRGETWNG